MLRDDWSEVGRRRAEDVALQNIWVKSRYEVVLIQINFIGASRACKCHIHSSDQRAPGDRIGQQGPVLVENAATASTWGYADSARSSPSRPDDQIGSLPDLGSWPRAAASPAVNTYGRVDPDGRYIS